MTAFPSLMDASYPLVEKVYKRQLRTEFEAGYVQSRAASTVSKKMWTLNWKTMPESDFQILQTFFEQNIGNVFDWTHPITLVTYKVRFTNDTLESTVRLNDLRALTLEIEEAPGV